MTKKHSNTIKPKSSVGSIKTEKTSMPELMQAYDKINALQPALEKFDAIQKQNKSLEL